MTLGFVSAILPELSFEEVLQTAADIGYDCVEVMCWPRGKAERRYAGVTHIDVEEFDENQAEEVLQLCQQYGVSISALGYYPNPLTPDEREAQFFQHHIRKVIRASALLGIHKMNTFVGRDWKLSIEENWSRFLLVWQPLIQYAASQGVYVGIENCPMLFTRDEWPGGKNLATSPTIWRRMFRDIDSEFLGLNYDPSHLPWNIPLGVETSPEPRKPRPPRGVGTGFEEDFASTPGRRESLLEEAAERGSGDVKETKTTEFVREPVFFID